MSIYWKYYTLSLLAVFIAAVLAYNFTEHFLSFSPYVATIVITAAATVATALVTRDVDAPAVMGGSLATIITTVFIIFIALPKSLLAASGG